MKKTLFAFYLLFLTASLWAGNYPVARLKTYPGDYKDCYQGTLFRCDKVLNGKTPVLYGYINFAPGTSAVTISLAYRSTETTDLHFAFSFNKQGGGNGSAGHGSKKSLPFHKEFATESLSYDVPLDAVTGQFLISIDGKPVELEIQSLSYELISDQVAIPQGAPTGMPSTWQEAARLQNFIIHTGGKPSTQTTVRMAYNDGNLYVGYICDEPTVAQLKAATTERDGSLWWDDDVELFLFDPDQNSGWQFIVNPANTQFDAVLRQAQAGDPYKANKSWNGDWNSQVFKNDASWEVALTIPWKTLGYDKHPDVLTMNFSHNRIATNETSHWNAFVGNLNDVPKFARATFGEKAQIVRYRKQETDSFIPKRARTTGAEILSSEPGGYIAYMGRHCYYRSLYPPAMQKDFTPEKQKELFERYASFGSWGPPLPWVAWERNVPGGINEVIRLNKTFGMLFPYAIYNSTLYRKTIEDFHTPLFYGALSDPATPEYLQTVLREIEGVRKFCAVPEQRKVLAFVEVIDEPTNHIPLIYNRKNNPTISKALDEFDAKVKQETGFGKYGFQDYGATPDEDSPFRRIAFWRYWNNHFADFLKTVGEAIRSIDPTIPYQGLNHNTCSGISEVNLAQLSPYSPELGCDPYPTSSRSFYGMARAIYHTGFSVKMVHDLASSSTTMTTLQCFIYHGGRPKPADIREWTSQAIKNGSQNFTWYASGPANVTMPDGDAEMEKLCRELLTMKKLPLPTETKSAILYNDYDRWGLQDKAGHAAYSVYALLGEHVKANFRFISPTGLANGLHTLKGISVLYIPRMRYTDPDTTKRLLEFVSNGGKLVVFDPTIWSWNIDGTPVPERELITGKLVERTAAANPLHFGKATLPVAPAMNLGRESGTVRAFDFASPEQTVIATYPDGKPAAVERKLGQGSLLLFAVQPFGGSDAATTPDGWPAFFQELCNQVGEKTNLPFWDFVLPGL